MGQNSAGSGERQRYPEDRFDRVARTGRVGAHRVTARPRYVWQFLIAGLLGFALLTTVGVLVVHNIGAAGKLPMLENRPKAAEPVKPEAKLDPAATVAVLNGSETPNLAASLDKIITDEEWGQILFSGAAASQDVKISAVFYADAADADAAAGLAAKLGGLSTYTTQDYVEYGTKLVVLLGSDYAGPGLEEAAALTVERGADSAIAPEGESDADGSAAESPEGQ